MIKPEMKKNQDASVSLLDISEDTGTSSAETIDIEEVGRVQVARLFKDINVAHILINEIKIKLADDEKKIELVTHEITNLKDYQFQIIETLGIFVALFTFISIDFQVFKYYRDPLAISGLVCILLGSLTFFISILDSLILKFLNKEKNKKKVSNWSRNKFILIELCLISLGIILFLCAKPIEYEDIVFDLKGQIIDSVKGDLISQNEKLDYKIKENNEEINQFNKNLSDIKKCVNNFGLTFKCFK